jgi:hypothetical protein
VPSLFEALAQGRPNLLPKDPPELTKLLDWLLTSWTKPTITASGIAHDPAEVRALQNLATEKVEAKQAKARPRPRFRGVGR